MTPLSLLDINIFFPKTVNMLGMPLKCGSTRFTFPFCRPDKPDCVKCLHNHQLKLESLCITELSTSLEIMWTSTFLKRIIERRVDWSAGKLSTDANVMRKPAYKPRHFARFTGRAEHLVCTTLSHNFTFHQTEGALVIKTALRLEPAVTHSYNPISLDMKKNKLIVGNFGFHLKMYKKKLPSVYSGLLSTSFITCHYSWYVYQMVSEVKIERPKKKNRQQTTRHFDALCHFLTSQSLKRFPRRSTYSYKKWQTISSTSRHSSS